MTGANPTADSVSEEMLFKQAPKISGRISIPDPKNANLFQPKGREWQRFYEDWMPWIGAAAVIGMVSVVEKPQMLCGDLIAHAPKAATHHT
ncbi:hypothetical protein [Methylorubrum extorquens]